MRLDPHGSWRKYRFMFVHPPGMLQMMANFMGYLIFIYIFQMVQDCVHQQWHSVLMSWLRSWPTPCRGHWVFPAQKTRECLGYKSLRNLDATLEDSISKKSESQLPDLVSLCHTSQVGCSQNAAPSMGVVATGIGVIWRAQESVSFLSMTFCWIWPLWFDQPGVVK